MKRVYILALILLLFNFAQAISDKTNIKLNKVTLHLQTDSSNVNVHYFNNQALKNYRKNAAFKYAETKTGITFWDRFWFWVWNLWARFWQWVGSLFEKLFGGVAMGRNAASVFKYVILGTAAILIVYIIFKLLGVDLLKIFKKSKSDSGVPFTESLENIHEINFDEAIENALSIKNYRLAVRLLYLKSLKQLSDNDLIIWKADKTNTAYINELTDIKQKRYFSMMTRQFEFVWYGEFPINGQLYKNINQIFLDFKQHLV